MRVLFYVMGGLWIFDGLSDDLGNIIAHGLVKSPVHALACYGLGLAFIAIGRTE